MRKPRLHEIFERHIAELTSSDGNYRNGAKPRQSIERQISDTVRKGFELDPNVGIGDGVSAILRERRMINDKILGVDARYCLNPEVIGRLPGPHYGGISQIQVGLGLSPGEMKWGSVDLNSVVENRFHYTDDSNGDSSIYADCSYDDLQELLIGVKIYDATWDFSGKTKKPPLHLQSFSPLRNLIAHLFPINEAYPILTTAFSLPRQLEEDFIERTFPV